MLKRVCWIAACGGLLGAGWTGCAAQSAPAKKDSGPEKPRSIADPVDARAGDAERVPDPAPPPTGKPPPSATVTATPPAAPEPLVTPTVSPEQFRPVWWIEKPERAKGEVSVAAMGDGNDLLEARRVAVAAGRARLQEAAGSTAGDAEVVRAATLKLEGGRFRAFVMLTAPEKIK